MFYRFMQETVVYLWLFYILNINPNIITVEMFKLPLLWKFHVASLSKKKSTTTTKNPDELETESLSFQKYEISENIQYNKFFSLFYLLH